MIGGISIGTVSNNTSTGGNISVVGNQSFPNISTLQFVNDFFKVTQSPTGQANITMQDLFQNVGELPNENIKLEKIYILPDGSWNYYNGDAWVSNGASGNANQSYDEVLNIANSTDKIAVHEDDNYLTQLSPLGLIITRKSNNTSIVFTNTGFNYIIDANKYITFFCESPTTNHNVRLRAKTGDIAFTDEIPKIICNSLASDITTTSSTALDTNLSFVAQPNECWYVTIDLVTGLGGGTSGGKYQFNGPADCLIEGGIQAQNSSSAVSNQRINAINTLSSAVKTVTLGGYLPDRIWFRIKTGATGGNIKFAVAANSTNPFTVKAGTTLFAIKTIDV